MKTKKIFTMMALAAGSALALAQSAEGPKPPAKVGSFDATAIDKSADPCTDFYQYACGNWDKSNPIPGDQTRWSRSFSLVAERNRYLLWQELDAAAKAPKSPLQKQYGDYYAACMDTATIDKKGAAPVQPAWAKIEGLKDAKQLPALLSALENAGVSDGFFGFGVGQDDKDSSKQIAQLGQGGLSLPDRDYYLVDNARFKAIRAQYVAHIAKMFELTGEAPAAAAQEAAAVLEIETAMAKASTSRTDLRDPANRYHIYTTAELAKLTPHFDWSTYFGAIGIGKFASLNVSTPEYFKALDGLLVSEPVSAWKSYLRWHALHGEARLLAKPFFDENFAFFSAALTGQKQAQPRWKMCTTMADNALGEAVGQDWVKENFPPEAKASMEKLVAALKKSLGDDIRDLPWMSEATKKAAEEKLNLFRQKIGYPEQWRDYSSVKVDRADLVGNVARASVFGRNYDYAKLGQPVNEKEWGMTPPTVNAYYDPSMNDINFPAGILQPPFFDFKIDPAVNFGAIGVVIGHEMTHGFDDEGSQYDGYGNLREWQTEADRKAFNERTQCEVDEYSNFVTAPATADAPEQKLNGKLTLGENTADNGGLRIAYMALEETLAAEGKTLEEKVDGYTEAQRYFLGFAQVWCQNRTEQSARQAALVDSHSPGKWRVNGSVQNFDAFGKAFGCHVGQPMMPAKSCRVW